MICRGGSGGRTTTLSHRPLAIFASVLAEHGHTRTISAHLRSWGEGDETENWGIGRAGLLRYVILDLLYFSSAIQPRYLSVEVTFTSNSTYTPLLLIRPNPALPLADLLHELRIKKRQRSIRSRDLHLESLVRIVEQRLHDKGYLDACDAAGGEEEDVVGAWPSVRGGDERLDRGSIRHVGGRICRRIWYRHW
jgi:hypothetical protein